MPTVASTAASAVVLLTGTVMPPVMENAILPVQPPATVAATTAAPSLPEGPVALSASWAQLGRNATVNADDSGWESTVAYQCQLPEMTRQGWQWMRVDLWQPTATGTQQHLVTWAAIPGSDCTPGRHTRRMQFHTSQPVAGTMSALANGQAWHTLTFGTYRSPNQQPITVVRGA